VVETWLLWKRVLSLSLFGDLSWRDDEAVGNRVVGLICF
jgi:hypothetical protein